MCKKFFLKVRIMLSRQIIIFEPSHHSSSPWRRSKVISLVVCSPLLLRHSFVLIIHCIVVWKCQFVFNKENWLEHKNMILASEEPDSQPAIRHSAPATTCCYHNEGRLLTQRFYDNILSPDIYIILVLKKFRRQYLPSI